MAWLLEEGEVRVLLSFSWTGGASSSQWEVQYQYQEVPREGRVLTRTMRWALRGRRLRVGVTARALFTFHYLVIWQQLLTLWERDASFNVYTATVGKN